MDKAVILGYLNKCRQSLVKFSIKTYKCTKLIYYIIKGNNDGAYTMLDNVLRNE